MEKEKQDILLRELSCLGQYYRNDWSDFDGRTLRYELNQLIKFIESDDKEFNEFSQQLKEQEEGFNN